MIDSADIVSGVLPFESIVNILIMDAIKYSKIEIAILTTPSQAARIQKMLSQRVSSIEHANNVTLLTARTLEFLSGSRIRIVTHSVGLRGIRLDYAVLDSHLQDDDEGFNILLAYKPTMNKNHKIIYFK